MEEDIKILEKYLKVGIFLNNRGCQALENLLKRNKELEKENQSYRDYLGEPPCYDNASYIPKSKIAEKIEEYQTNMKKYEYADKKIFNENNIRQEVITVLTELLMEDK